MVWWYRYSGCRVWHRGCVFMPGVDVTLYIFWFGVIEWVHCHLQCKGCHTYAECCIINTECCNVILSGYYVTNIVHVMLQIYWMWGHTYSRCDIIDTVVVITAVQRKWGQTVWTWSHIKWYDVLNCGCDVYDVYDVYDVVHMMSYT